jgi:hypothetical protein
MLGYWVGTMLDPTSLDFFRRTGATLSGSRCGYCAPKRGLKLIDRASLIWAQAVCIWSGLYRRVGQTRNTHDILLAQAKKMPPSRKINYHALDPFVRVCWFGPQYFILSGLPDRATSYKTSAIAGARCREPLLSACRALAQLGFGAPNRAKRHYLQPDCPQPTTVHI